MAETKKKNIFETISAVMEDIGAIGKNDKNNQQNFMYRGIDAVMNAINPALVKFKLFVVPEVLEQIREERQTRNGSTLIYSICKIKYTFYAEDGSNVSAIVVGEGMDSGDKATNKAMSVAFKYACFQVFCIPTEEMVDPDAECHEVTPKAKGEAAPKPKAKPTPKAAERTEAPQEEDRRPKIFAQLKTFCAEHDIDYKKYKLMSNSPVTAFEKAYSQAVKEAEEMSEATLPFEV